MGRPWSRSILQIFAAGGAAGVTGQEAEHEDPDEKENDGVNRNLEGEHGRACGIEGLGGDRLTGGRAPWGDTTWEASPAGRLLNHSMGETPAIQIGQGL